jgi:peroxiredoxin family protein
MLGKAAEEQCGLKICACSASCNLLGLDIKSVREKVDEIVGLPTMLKIAAEVKHVMYL